MYTRGYSGPSQSQSQYDNQASQAKPKISPGQWKSIGAGGLTAAQNNADILLRQILAQRDADRYGKTK